MVCEDESKTQTDGRVCVCVNKFNVQINKIHGMLSSSLATWFPLPFRSL